MAQIAESPRQLQVRADAVPEDVRRITTAIMERAFFATGIFPDFSSLYGLDPLDGSILSASPVVAHALACGMDAAGARVESLLAEKLRLSPEYVRGFHHGWFGLAPCRDHRLFREGWRDGSKCHANAWDRFLNSCWEVR